MFNSLLLEAMVSAADKDAACQDEYVRAMERSPSPVISFEDEALYYIGRLDSGQPAVEETDIGSGPRFEGGWTHWAE
jgi:hypothetical protein